MDLGLVELVVMMLGRWGFRCSHWDVGVGGGAVAVAVAPAADAVDVVDVVDAVSAVFLDVFAAAAAAALPVAVARAADRPV